LFVAVLQNAEAGLVSPDVPARKAAAAALGTPFPEHVPIRLERQALLPFAGQYGSDGKTTHTVRLDGDTLLLQRGGPVRRLLPYGPAAFAVEESLVTVEFTRGADGRVTGLAIDDTNERKVLVRTGDKPAREPVALPAAVFDAYRGRYELAPGVRLEISRDGTRFYGQATGQPRVEITATGPRTFYSDEADAELEFIANADGSIDALLLRQHGRETRARRVD
jgi:hypothetical protein